jgi:hypothetical protein
MTVIVLYPPKGKAIFVERIEKGKYRRGWLDRAELRVLQGVTAGASTGK